MNFDPQLRPFDLQTPSGQAEVCALVKSALRNGWARRSQKTEARQTAKKETRIFEFHYARFSGGAAVTPGTPHGVSG